MRSSRGQILVNYRLPYTKTDHFINSLTDLDFVKLLKTKVNDLYHRLSRVHDNIEKILYSITVWSHISFSWQIENNYKIALDINDRSLSPLNRSFEVNASKKLINDVMDTNFRLLFNLPCPETKKEQGKIRLRETIFRQFGNPINIIGKMKEIVCQTNDLEILEHQTPKTDEQEKQFQPYKRFIDGLVFDALKYAIHQK